MPEDGGEVQETDNSSNFEITRDNWLMNRIDKGDIAFMSTVDAVDATLPPVASIREIAEGVKDYIVEAQKKISSDLSIVDQVIRNNRESFKDKFKGEGNTIPIGEFFNPDKPANVCQQNVLLLSAVAAKKGFEVKVAPFMYTGKTSGNRLVHAVGIYEDSVGKQYVLDPTLRVPHYGDVTFVDKEDYLSRFDEPDLAEPVSIFKSSS